MALLFVIRAAYLFSLCISRKEEGDKVRIIIAGGRDFANTGMAFRCLKSLVKAGDVIISGHASGADTIGELYAQKNGLSCELYPADWKKYGKAAGPIRNEEMAKTADMLIAFWDGKSRGTKSMIELSKKHDCQVFVFDYYGNERLV